MITLTDYQFQENLYQGTRTLVYRGTRTIDKQPVIIKVLRNPHPNFNELVQFRNQYAIAKHLEHPAIVKPLALERYGNGYALVMPDSGAISLSDYWQECDRSLAEFLNIGIQLADALHYLSGERIIHKDIKPANILICPETHQIKLIDFSISSLLPKEQQQLINPNVLEGTLAYISPEQTGRMNRGIDYRTDFYSLGVTFYELLTGILPFDASDPMKLVHCHIAETPLALHIFTDGRDKSHPKVISDIVLKLMAKNAEDRYQSALGLKHDLEQCLQQLQSTGEITSFEIGQRDICDRFSIPEKLYGRETEVQALLDAFQRVSQGNTELMLVAGFSGIGKTVVVNEVHKPIVKQRGYFIKGKFDQFNRNIPFLAFVQALRDLMGQLLSESDAELANWKKKLLSILGENAQVIIEVIPELERIIGKQPAVPELSGSAAQNRFNLLFSKFIQVFTTVEHPLVMFLDDLQWADLASLSLLKLLIGASETGYLLVLGAYRDNEVSPAHPLILTLDEIEKQEANIHALILAALGQADITQLVADTLRCSLDMATPLAELVAQKTQGNPFFTTQFLAGLHEDDYITFDSDALYWQCDLTNVRDLALTDDVVEFMVGRLQKLPKSTQDILKFAACIGNKFDLETLAIALESPTEKVATDLWSGLQEGFVVPQNENYKFFQVAEGESNRSEVLSVSYRFLHDRVQQAAYALIPENEKQNTHFKIGQLLLNNIPESEQKENIFTLVNQLNYGVDLIDKQTEREQLSRLNLTAGIKAKTATAYSAAVGYFAVGRKLLQDDCWQSQYELTLKLFESSAEAAYLNGEFEIMDELIEQVLQSTRSPLAQVKVYEVKLQAYAVKNQFVQAIKTAFSVLKLFGVSFPESPTDADIQRAFADTKSQWSDRSIEELKNLPAMSDPEQIATLRILGSITGAAYIALPQFLPFIVCEQIKLSIKYGNARWSAFSYSIYGTILCGVLDDIESGYQFGQLASQLLSKFDAPELTAKVVINTDGDIRHWKQPARDTIKPLFLAYQIGLETGDIEFAAYCASYGSFNSYFTGTPLIELESEVAKYSQAFQKLKQETVFYWSEIHRQGILNLITSDRNPGRLVGEAYNEEESLPFHHSVNDLLALHMVHSHKLILNYLFDRAEKAVENAAIAEKYLNGVTAMFVIPAFYLYDSLARLQWLNDRPDPQFDRQLEKVADNQAKMQKWAHHAPMNHLHKWQLVAAEQHRVLGNKIEAIELYDRAIAGAKENEYIQEEALANELAAKFYLDWGKEKIAATYMTDAYYGYARWGAKAKTDQLEAKYPQLLWSILQQQFESKPVDSITFPTQTITAIKHTKSSTTSISDTLDFASLLQAAQALSDIIELNPLLADICRIILTNAGTQKAVLLIPQNDQWQLRAIAQLKNDGTLETNTRSQTLTADSPVPIRLIQYVKNTQKTVLINEGKTDISGILKGYLLEYQPQSVLCLPLVNQSNLVAILYLEHPTTKGIFTPARQRILQFLCTQAAIALKNAQLYEQAQKALLDLQQAQLQLVQSEKMSALGNLVAGVAHEINNPTGFLQGNIQPAQDYLQDLLEFIDFLLEQSQNNDSGLIEEKIEEIDLEFIRSDFPELLKSMSLGVERIRHISKSLRTFSRKDEEHQTTFKLDEGIDSTLLILKHRTKANEHRPEIEIIKEYQEIPEVQCFPGQLNQVFMNIIANAIDAFEEANQGKTYAQIKQNPNQIKIRISQLDETRVQIQIKDNGCGMKPETKARIFEQGYTTKAVGKGTGLGMAIAHQIITEKHGGTISCTSELGKGTEFYVRISLGN